MSTVEDFPLYVSDVDQCDRCGAQDGRPIGVSYESETGYEGLCDGCLRAVRVGSQRLATLEREEARTRALHDDALHIVGNIPEGEATDEHLDHVTGAYMAWVRAWEALAATRRELAKKH